jgi:hypothetical protein
VASDVVVLVLRWILEMEIVDAWVPCMTVLLKGVRTEGGELVAFRPSEMGNYFYLDVYVERVTFQMQDKGAVLWCVGGKRRRVNVLLPSLFDGQG